MEMQPLEALVAIVAIVFTLGLGGYIALKFIQLLRDWLVPRNEYRDSDAFDRRIEEFEHRQDQLTKRIQNLETIIVDADPGNFLLKEGQSGTEISRQQKKTETERPLKNKLRS